MNNRQNGRRRGRGGQRPQGLGGGGGGGGNSREQRSRGNAAQLLEKYKNMARDSQLAGDRVQTEYYLQFADHYFRILSETRSRFEDQRPQSDDEDEGDDELIDGEGEEEMAEVRSERQPRQDRSERFERRERAPDRERPAERERAAERERPVERERSAERPRRERAERRPRFEREEEPAEFEPAAGIAVDLLPPAIGPVASDEPVTDEIEEAPRPRRRTRRPRAAEGGEEIAPAA